MEDSKEMRPPETDWRPDIKPAKEKPRPHGREGSPEYMAWLRGLKKKKSGRIKNGR
ncbi:MAG: hypothetical protein ABSA11_10515 [Candidatus Bathyarchaeia archaeon]